MDMEYELELQEVIETLADRVKRLEARVHQLQRTLAENGIEDDDESDFEMTDIDE